MPGDAKVIATAFLSKAFYASAALAPLGSYDGAATIGSRFFEAGRFTLDQVAQVRKHCWDTRAQCVVKRSWQIGFRHGPDMLAMAARGGNRGNRTFRKLWGSHTIMRVFEGQRRGSQGTTGE